MRKYSFRLDNVRRVRRVEEDLAKAQLLNANSEVRKAEQARDEMMQAYQTSLSSAPTSSVNTQTFLQGRFFNDLAGKAVVAAQEARREAEAEAARKRLAFTEAARKVKALDRLDEKGREEYRVEFDRHTDAEIDEVVTTRFGRNS